MLDERKEQILDAIIDDYIRTAEPVGSKLIAERYHLSVSPATIRSEMACLEELGYLRQPHTSAGRVPTDKGYRHYVDRKVCFFAPSSQEEQAFFLRLREIREKEIEGLLHEISLLLANFTDNISLVLSLPVKRRIYLWGLTKILHQPEFGNVHKVEFLFELLECEEKVADLLMQGIGEKRVRVLIGTENELNELKDLSLILASYGLAGRPWGSVGILGPTRMDYLKAIPAVDLTARGLSQMLEKAYG